VPLTIVPLSHPTTPEDAGACAQVSNDDQQLKLAELPSLSPSTKTRQQTIYQGPRRGRKIIRWVVLLILVGVALFWALRDENRLLSLIGASPSVPKQILLLIETEPKKAHVFVDGVLSMRRSIQLPRGNRTYTIEVRAKGYYPKTLHLTGKRTRSMIVKLRRR
jgi:hypothetical protein